MLCSALLLRLDSLRVAKQPENRPQVDEDRGDGEYEGQLAGDECKQHIQVRKAKGDELVFQQLPRAYVHFKLMYAQRYEAPFAKRCKWNPQWNPLLAYPVACTNQCVTGAYAAEYVYRASSQVAVDQPKRLKVSNKAEPHANR